MNKTALPFDFSAKETKCSSSPIILSSCWDSDKVCRTCYYNRSGFCWYGDEKVGDNHWCSMWKPC